MPMLVPEQQRRFALDVVRRLREAGFEAYWAGGCVRDQLLRRPPKDYDVATNATPRASPRPVRPPPTLAIGAAFGVIAVLGPQAAGMVEVATFRRDAAYSDGRHPDSVTFSSARGRRLAPRLHHQRPVLRSGGGAGDRLRRRAGRPGRRVHPRHRAARERFAEDKLRMLRAVRFAAAFGFALDAETRAAIAEMAGQIHVVSPERIAMEMRPLLADPGRGGAVRLLVETGLAAAVLPEIVPGDDGTAAAGSRAGGPGRLEHPAFPWPWRRCSAWPTRRRAGGLPPLAAVQPRDRPSRLAGRAPRRPGRRTDDALVGAPAAVGRRGHRRPPGFTRRPRRRRPKTRPIAARCWHSPGRCSIRRPW